MKLKIIKLLILSFGLASCGATKTQFSNIVFNSGNGQFSNGESELSLTIQTGSKISAPEDPSRIGYELKKENNKTVWLTNLYKIDFDDYVVNGDVNLNCIWIPINYKINYELDGGTQNTNNKNSYTVENFVELFSPSKYGYTFNGWMNDNQEIVDCIKPGSTGDITLRAIWSVNSFCISTSSSDLKKGTVSPGGIFNLNEEIEITAFPENGYEFNYWAINGSIVRNNPFLIKDISSNVSAISYFKLKTYFINYDSGGVNFKNNNPSTYSVEDSFHLKKPVVQGYTFLGWENEDGDIVESIEKGTFGNLLLKARWSYNSYLVKYKCTSRGYESYCSFPEPKYYYYGEKCFVNVDNFKNGYELGVFFIWVNDYCIGSSISPLFLTIVGDSEIRFSVETIPYSISYDLHGGTAKDLINTYNIESEFDLPIPILKGFAFKGWKTQYDEIIYSIEPGRTDDLFLYAIWIIDDFNLNIIFDESLGSLSGAGKYTYKTEVAHKATWLDDNLFEYKSSNLNANNLIDINKEITYIINGETILLAKFINKEIFDFDIKHANLPFFDGEKYTYGRYPQSVVDNSQLISKLEEVYDDDQLYTLYNGEYYYKLSKATTFEENYTFSNGSQIIENMSYWFLVEPLVWNVETYSGKEFLSTNVALDRTCFDSSQFIRDKKYEDSTIKNSWLPFTFKKKGFCFCYDYSYTPNLLTSSQAKAQKQMYKISCDSSIDCEIVLTIEFKKFLCNMEFSI